MKKYALLFCLILFFAPVPYLLAVDEGDESRFIELLRERDWIALREFLQTKKEPEIHEKPGKFAIGGDIRVDWRHLNEKDRGKWIRGGRNRDLLGIPISRNDIDIEFNLRMDYNSERAWGVVHLQFDNTAGINGARSICRLDPEAMYGSGACSDLCLRKAFFGYNICTDRDSRFDIELGRRSLYHAFDSKIQYSSRFDGILLVYSNSWEYFADWYIKGAGFVVDERVNHFAWIAETGLINIFDSGIDFKYSIIDWKKHGRNRCGTRDPLGTSYLNSQFLMYYNLPPNLLCGHASRFYGAFIVNHASRSLKLPELEKKESSSCDDSQSVSDPCDSDSDDRFPCTKNKRYAWYVGFRVGNVVVAGDWAFDVNYQVVQANAIPDNDVSGIARGNYFRDSYTRVGRGNTNYRGWHAEGLYAITDHFTVNVAYNHTREDCRKIGGTHSYNELKVEAIYAF